ncbi:MAG: hypothetical protein IJ761_07810 [Bacteroidales bacterium]|nr:hypothetical protein [Bacteroidales bacterium]
MKTLKKTLMALVVLFMVGNTQAQRYYVVDAQFGNTAAAYSVKKADKKGQPTVDKQVATLPNGTIVAVAARDTTVVGLTNPLIHKNFSDTYVKVTHKGKSMYVSTRDLVYSTKNAEGTKSFFKVSDKQHSPLGHFYYTSAPYLGVFVLMVIATMLGIMMARRGANAITAILFPLLMLTAIAIEIGGVLMLGSDMLWWLDTKRFGWGKPVFWIVLFVATLIMQFYSMRLYKSGICESPDDLSIKAPIVGVIVGAVLVVVSIAIAGYTHKNDEMWLWIGAGALVVSTITGIVISMRSNIRALGGLVGLAFSLFAIIYGIGMVTAVVLFVMGFLKVFLEMIITIVGAIALLVVGSKLFPSRSYTRSDGTIVEVYEDFHI